VENGRLNGPHRKHSRRAIKAARSCAHADINKYRVWLGCLNQAKDLYRMRTEYATDDSWNDDDVLGSAHHKRFFKNNYDLEEYEWYVEMKKQHNNMEFKGIGTREHVIILKKINLSGPLRKRLEGMPMTVRRQGYVGLPVLPTGYDATGYTLPNPLWEYDERGRRYTAEYPNVYKWFPILPEGYDKTHDDEGVEYADDPPERRNPAWQYDPDGRRYTLEEPHPEWPRQVPEGYDATSGQDEDGNTVQYAEGNFNPAWQFERNGRMYTKKYPNPDWPMDMEASREVWADAIEETYLLFRKNWSERYVNHAGRASLGETFMEYLSETDTPPPEGSPGSWNSFDGEPHVNTIP